MKSVITQIRTVTEFSGSLSFFEADKDISFPIKRIFYVYGVPKNGIRGKHAHKTNKQLLFCPYGQIKIILDDGKGRKSEVILDNPSVGLILNECTWVEMVWLSEGSVLCVAASEYYNENESIRDYDEFIQYVNNE